MIVKSQQHRIELCIDQTWNQTVVARQRGVRTSTNGWRPQPPPPPLKTSHIRTTQAFIVAVAFTTIGKTRLRVIGNAKFLVFVQFSNFELGIHVLNMTCAIVKLKSCTFRPRQFRLSLFGLASMAHHQNGGSVHRAIQGLHTKATVFCMLFLVKKSYSHPTASFWTTLPCQIETAQVLLGQGF